MQGLLVILEIHEAPIEGSLAHLVNVVFDEEMHQIENEGDLPWRRSPQPAYLELLRR